MRAVGEVGWCERGGWGGGGAGEIQGRSLRCKADGSTDRAAADRRPATQPAAGPATQPGPATQGRSRSPQPPRARRGTKTHGPETRTNVRSVYIF